MKELLRSIIRVVMVSAVGFWLLSPIVLISTVIRSHYMTAYLMQEVEYYSDKYKYFFKGANERRLIDFCKNEDGEIEILFKEDC